MLAVTINNPEIESIFASEFASDESKFIEFVAKSLRDLQHSNELSYIKKNPFKNIKKIKYDGNNEQSVMPYAHIQNSAEYIHNLRRQK
jgi:hypothetical protein